MTSSLSALPPNLNQDVLPQPVRKTYGRARHVSPPGDDDGPTVSLFRPTEEIESRPSRPPIADASPAKNLLNRFSAVNTSWHNSLAHIDADHPDDEEGMSPQPKGKRGGLFDFTRHVVGSDNGEKTDEEDDMEATKAALERMRREARGEAPKAVSAISAPEKPTLKVPLPLLPTTSSSSLSDAPPSSSPSRRARLARIADEESVPIRKSSTAGPSGRVKRVIVSDEEESDDEPRATRRISTPSIGGDSDNDERIPDMAEALRNESAPEVSAPAPSRHDAFFEKLQEEEDDEAPVPVNSQSSGDSVGLFDDEEPTTQKTGGLKPLNKKDQIAMRQDIARAQRERQPRRSRPQPAYMPVSSWMEQAQKVVFPQRNPGLTRGHSPPTSPSQTTPPDDIGSFTPSSNDHIRSRIKSSIIQSRSTATRGGHSSPTPNTHAPTRPMHSDGVPGTSDGVEDDDERIPDMPDALAEARVKQAQEAELKAKQEQLRLRKAAALRANTTQKATPVEEDDFEILPDEHTPKPRARFASTGSPNAKAVLQKSNKSPAISKARQDYLRRAGRSTRPKEDLTETYIEVAAKTFNHAGQRQASGGARPAGQKAGRDRPLSTTQMNAKMQEASRAQAALVRQKKEEAWGKVRVLPQKRQLDMQAVIQASARYETREVEEDEDEEDGDFVPEGEDMDQDVEMDDVENGFATPAEQDEDDVQGSESGESHGTDKENQPAPVEHDTSDPADEDDEDTPIIRRRPRPSARVEVNSDDEGEVRPRAPLEEIVPVQTTPTAPVFDLGGFGDGSPGFSQLFEATQLNTATSKDGLANLREADQPGYLAVNALLPGVDISETQIERDNAVIAAELEAAHPQPSLPQDRPRYLNDQGFFTQTKPLAPTHPQTLLRRTSTSLGDIQITEEDEEDEERTPSTTEKGSSVPLTGPDSPTQTNQTFTRLRRRASSPDIPLQNTFGDPATLPTQNNAFAHMMKASKRREARQQALDHNLIDEQAEESDEDMGWGLAGGDEDEEEGNDEGYIQDLVDDQAIDEEQRRLQDELAAAKAREIAEADDAKREAEAKKITEGHYRTKRRGMDFFSDEEGDEERGGKRRKLSKEERRALRKRRLLDREDGLEKLDGEENAFAQTYNADLQSDEDSTVEDEMPERGATRSPTPEMQQRSGKDKWDMLRQRARLNKEHGDAEDDLLDQEIGYTRSGFAAIDEEMTTDVEDESQFSISRGKVRAAASFVDLESGYSLQTRRSADSYAKYVQDESQTTRRANGTAGVSVVQPSHGRSAPSLVSRSSASQLRRPPSRADSSSSGGSILQSRGSKFN